MVNGEMRPSGISQELELIEFSELLFGSQDDSRSARWFSASRAPDARSPAGRSYVNGLGSGKLVGVKFPAGEPEGPQGEQDFTLGIQPRMGSGAGVAQGKLIEVPDGTGATFGGLEIGAIADGFQG